MRRLKAYARLTALESEFTEKLVAAVRDCAAGRWGLFGQYDAIYPVRSEAPELFKLGGEICALRRELGFAEPFFPYDRFLHYRSLRGPHVQGEPKLAAALLQELLSRQ